MRRSSYIWLIDILKLCYEYIPLLGNKVKCFTQWKPIPWDVSKGEVYL